MTLRKIFADNVRALRKAKGWSQEELADRAALHRTYISSIERALRNVSLDNIEVIAAALGEAPSALVTQQERPVHCAG